VQYTTSLSVNQVLTELGIAGIMLEINQEAIMLVDITVIEQERIKARGKDLLAYNLLTTLLGDLQLEQKRSGNTNAEPVIRKFIKSAELVLDAAPGNDQAIQELAILKGYLPKQLTEEQLKSILSQLGQNTAMSYFMAYLKANYTGQYDGKLASQIYRGI
jgi:hypothetical protein